MKPLFTRMLPCVLNPATDITYHTDESNGLCLYTLYSASDSGGAAGGNSVNTGMARNGINTTTKRPDINGSKTEHSGGKMTGMPGMGYGRCFCGKDITCCKQAVLRKYLLTEDTSGAAWVMRGDAA